MGRERRSKRRVSLDILVNKVQDGIPAVGLARDLSVRGMRVARLLEPQLFQSDEVLIEFQLPLRDETFFVGAQRVHETGPNSGEVGYRFTNITPGDSLMLQDYISARVQAT